MEAMTRQETEGVVRELLMPDAPLEKLLSVLSVALLEQDSTLDTLHAAVENNPDALLGNAPLRSGLLNLYRDRLDVLLGNSSIRRAMKLSMHFDQMVVILGPASYFSSELMSLDILLSKRINRVQAVDMDGKKKLWVLLENPAVLEILQMLPMKEEEGFTAASINLRLLKGQVGLEKLRMLLNEMEVENLIVRDFMQDDTAVFRLSTSGEHYARDPTP
jgi:hypothetical protein